MWVWAPLENQGANCGIASGGFQPGNTCAKGGGVGEDPKRTIRLAKRKERREARKAAKKEAAKGITQPPAKPDVPWKPVTPPPVASPPPWAPPGGVVAPPSVQPSTPSTTKITPINFSRHVGSITKGPDESQVRNAFNLINEKTGGGLAKLLQRKPIHAVMIRKNMASEGCLGVYDFNGRKISLLSSDTRKPVTKGQTKWTVGNDVAYAAGSRSNRSKGVESTAVHEIAHHIDNIIHIAKMGSFGEAAKHISQYAKTESKEYWAEAFSAHIYGKKLPQAAQQMVDQAIASMQRM